MQLARAGDVRVHMPGHGIEVDEPTSRNNGDSSYIRFGPAGVLVDRPA
jgi:hypothetical protein